MDFFPQSPHLSFLFASTFDCSASFISSSDFAVTLFFSLAALRSYQQQPASLDLPIGEEEDTSIGDFVPATNMQSNPEKSAVYSSLCDALEKAMDSLTERERAVLEMRYGLNGEKPQTLEKIGSKMNVTRERIRQIEAKALMKMRSPRRKALLRDYL